MTNEEFRVLQEIVNTPRPNKPLPTRVVRIDNKYKIDEVCKQSVKKKKVNKKKYKKVKIFCLTGLGTIAIVSSFIIGGKFSNNKIVETLLDEEIFDRDIDQQDTKSLLNDSIVSSIVDNTQVDGKDFLDEQSVNDDVSDNNIIVDSSRDQNDVDYVSNEVFKNDDTSVNDNIKVDVSSDIDDSSIKDNIENDNSSSNDVTNIKESFEVGTSSDIDGTNYFLENTIEGYLIRYYSEMYGVDPNIVAAICYQESGGVNLIDSGAAQGIMMLEVMGDYDLTVYNYKEQQYETITVSSSRTDDLEYNIRCGIANLRNKIDYCNGNIYAALQAYNYNEVTLMNALNQNGYNLNDYNDCGWLYITEDVTDNPQKYGIDWPEGKKYGVANYPVYTGYHLINKIITYNYKDKQITMNYATGEIINVEDIEYYGEKVR